MAKDIAFQDENGNELYPWTIVSNVIGLSAQLSTFAAKDGSNISNISTWQNVLNDLTTPSLTDSTAHTQTGQATVIESYLSSDKRTWYRKWSDGWKECGGTIYVAGNSSGTELVFPVNFTTKVKTINLTFVSGIWDGNRICPKVLGVNSGYDWITSVRILNPSSSNGYTEGYVSYYVCGY